MRIVNVMLSRHAGGIEQVLADYCRAQAMYGHEPVAVTHPEAWINDALIHAGVPVYPLRNGGAWDVLAARRLRGILNTLRPDAVIAHANRALTLSSRALHPKRALIRKAVPRMPLIAVANNYSTRLFSRADAAFAPTRDLVEDVKKRGVHHALAFHVPNMIALPEASSASAHDMPAPRRSPPVIGSMGRFVAKKGFDVYLRALALLKARGIEFTALLGGAGAEEARLKQLAESLGLQGTVRFCGWVEDRQAFYESIDIFCLPSLHEPFGIVLLEAFAHCVPVVATDTEGPADIITPGREALIVPRGDAEALANGLAALLADEALCAGMVANARVELRAHYTHEAVGARMHAALAAIMRDFHTASGSES